MWGPLLQQQCCACLRGVGPTIPRRDAPQNLQESAEGWLRRPYGNRRKREYSAYKKGRIWRRLRRARLDLDGHACTSPDCGDPAAEVHQIWYPPLGRLNETRIEHLRSVCTDCHDLIHARRA